MILLCRNKMNMELKKNLIQHFEGNICKAILKESEAFEEFVAVDDNIAI